MEDILSIMVLPNYKNVSVVSQYVSGFHDYFIMPVWRSALVVYLYKYTNVVSVVMDSMN